MKNLFLLFIIIPNILFSQSIDEKIDFKQYRKFEKYINTGNKASESKKYESAIKYYTKAIDIYPFNVVGYFNRGITKNKLKNYISAIEDFNKVIEINSKHTRAYIERGNSKYGLQNYSGALEDYKACLQIDSTKEAAKKNIVLVENILKDFSSNPIPDYLKLFNEGVEKNNNKDYRGAINKFDSVILLKPDYIEAYNSKSYSYFLLMDYQSSMEACKEGLAKDSINTDLHFKLGMLYLNSKKYKEAVNENNIVLQLDSNYNLAYFQRACANTMLGYYREAMIDLYKTIQTRPNYPNGYITLSACYINLNKLDSAMEMLNKAIEINPNMSDAYHNRGIVYYRMKKYEEALEDFNKVIELEPNNYDASLKKADAHRGLRDYRSAINEYTRTIGYNRNDKTRLATLYGNRGYCKSVLDDCSGAAIDIDSANFYNANDKDILWNKAGFLACCEQYDEAFDAYLKVLELNKGDTANMALIYKDLGFIKKIKEQYEEAATYFSKAIEYNPEFADAYHQRGLMRKQLNNLKGAEEDFTKAVQLKPNCTCNRSEQYLELLKTLLGNSNNNKYEVKVYPNVFTSSFSVETNIEEGVVTIILYDMLGKEVKRLNDITSQHVEIERGNLATGTYLYQIRNNDIVIYEGKIVVQ